MSDEQRARDWVLKYAKQLPGSFDVNEGVKCYLAGLSGCRDTEVKELKQEMCASLMGQEHRLGTRIEILEAQVKRQKDKSDLWESEYVKAAKQLRVAVEKLENFDEREFYRVWSTRSIGASMPENIMYGARYFSDWIVKPIIQKLKGGGE